MADNTVVFPRKLLKKFIVLYKDLPCLWDKECPAYKIKKKRHDAITKLTQLVQEYDATATRVHALRKIESLRACVRREYKRVKDSRRNATSEEEIYTPHLWYYDLFSFILRDEENEYKIMKEAAGSPEAAAETEDEEVEDDSNQYDNRDFTHDFTSSNILEIDDDSPITKRYMTMDEEPSSSKVKRHLTEIEDEYDAIGINVAAKLRYLPLNMRVLAEKLINDVLFQAQVNGLMSSTVISTPDPFKQDLHN